MRNLTQSTYDRIVEKVRPLASDRYPKGLANQDARDLLLAYESALQLLDALVGVSHNASGSREVREAEEFLYLEDGFPRVGLDVSDDDDFV